MNRKKRTKAEGKKKEVLESLEYITFKEYKHMGAFFIDKDNAYHTVLHGLIIQVNLLWRLSPRRQLGLAHPHFPMSFFYLGKYRP